MSKKRFTRTENEVSVEEDEAVETNPVYEDAPEEVTVDQEAPVEPVAVATEEVPAPAPVRKREKVVKGKVYYGDGSGGRFRI